MQTSNGLSFRHGDQTITLAGANSSHLVNGFWHDKRRTAEAWEAFEKNHKDAPFIRNGIVFAVTDEKSAADASLERSRQKTGLEQVNAKDAGVEEDKEE